MLDIFFKKKQKEPPAAEKKEVRERLEVDDKIAIHVMPEHFRKQTVKVDSAKKTGLVIIVGGAAVLLAVSGALYYFLFSLPKKAVAPAEQTETTGNQPAAPAAEPVAAPAITETATLPSGNEAATSTAATSTPETASSTAAAVSYSFGLDSDQDGLTDKEEALLGASPLTPDTDSDGYFDGAELKNLYDPASPGKLIDNPAAALYENKTFNYNLIYPRAFMVSTNGGDDSVMFKTDDNQFIQAIVQPNVNAQTLEAWYLDQLAVLSVKESDRLSGVGWQGLKSPDGLTVYLMDGRQNYIFGLSYNLGGGNITEYLNIYEMMVKSFTLK